MYCLYRWRSTTRGSGRLRADLRRVTRSVYNYSMYGRRSRRSPPPPAKVGDTRQREHAEDGQYKRRERRRSQSRHEHRHNGGFHRRRHGCVEVVRSGGAEASAMMLVGLDCRSPSCSQARLHRRLTAAQWPPADVSSQWGTSCVTSQFAV